MGRGRGIPGGACQAGFLTTGSHQASDFASQTSDVSFLRRHNSWRMDGGPHITNERVQRLNYVKALSECGEKGKNVD